MVRSVLVIVDAGCEEELAPGDGVREVVEEAGSEAQAGRLAAQLLPPEVVQRLPQPLLQPRRQLARLSPRRAQHRVATQLLLQ